MCGWKEEGKDAQADAFEGDLQKQAEGVAVVSKRPTGMRPKRDLEKDGNDGDGNDGDANSSSADGSDVDADDNEEGKKRARRASGTARVQRGKKDAEALAELQANRLQHEKAQAQDNRAFLDNMAKQNARVLEAVQQSSERLAIANAQAAQAQASAAQAQAQSMLAAAQANAQAAQANAQALGALAAVLQKFAPQ